MPAGDYYTGKHARARAAVALDPTRRDVEARPLEVGTRVHGAAGALRGHRGVVTRSTWNVLPAGQMVVRFDEPVIDRWQIIAVLPDEVQAIA